jgi:hypothetical protein
MNIETLPRPADLVVEPGEAWVRAAHENYSRTVPDLCGTLHENATEVWFLLFVPELGQVLTYRADKPLDAA